MTISSARIAVGTVTPGTVAYNDATEFQTLEGDRGGLNRTRPRHYALWNAGAAPAYLGDSNVAGTTGYTLGAGSALNPVQLEPGETLFAIAGTATTLHVLRQGD